MLSRGFKDQIYDVYRYLPPDLQVGMGWSIQLSSIYTYIHIILYSEFFESYRLC